MITIYQENQEQQYKLAKEGLDRYNSMLRTADYMTRHERALVVKSLDEFLEQTNTRQLPAVRELRDKAKKLKEELVKDAHRSATLIEEDKGIEVIINQYNGNTEVLLPIRQEDLTAEGTTLMDKLYHHSEKVLEEKWSLQQKIFEGYVVFSFDEPVQRKEVAKSLLQNAPKEFQGNPLYVRVANNFCFSYQTTAAGEAREKPASRTLPPTGTSMITRNEAVELFKRGMTSPQIHEQYPGTPKWTIAGWKSWWSKRGC